MDYIAENRAVTNFEMEQNAIVVHKLLKKYGFSENAIAGILGNMECESRINSGAWQSYNKNKIGGFGLVQWTPATKLTEWLDKNGYKHDDLEGQCNRIIWELENGKQFYKTETFSISFLEFKTSEQTPEYLAEVFLNNYERPSNRNQPLRSKNARKWFDYFNVSRETLEGIVTGNHVNIRTKPHINSSVIGQKNKNEKVKVLEQSGNWVKIETAIIAFIHSNYIK